LPKVSSSPDDVVKAMSLDLFFDYLGVLLNGPKAAGKKITLNMNFPDTKEKYVLTLENDALNHTPGKQTQDADATITITRAALNKIMLDESSLANEVGSGQVEIEGRKEAFTELMSLLDTFEFWFNIVTP
jgi:alkyl sulfatase BDS1-like metallo-beta-lactamase superfamily hydrolase